MRLVPLVRKLVGTLLAVACFGIALYALFRLVQAGSCSSGGNHVSNRACPPGSGWWATELPLGIIGGLLFLGLGHIKFGRTKPVPAPDLATRAQQTRWPAETTQTFTSGGERPAGWPPNLPWPLAGVDFQNATVVRMSGEEAVDQDPLARLERLRALRDANALTSAEYDAAKAKILSQM